MRGKEGNNKLFFNFAPLQKCEVAGGGTKNATKVNSTVVVAADGMRRSSEK